MSFEEHNPHPRQVQITLDGDSLVLPSREVSPNQILTIAQLDPTTHYLVLVEGRHQVSYQGKGDDTIQVHNNEAFISLSTGPTPTS